MYSPLWLIRQNSSYWISPSGLAQLAWEQTVLNHFSDRIFGYYAVSVELHSLSILHKSPIPHIFRIDAADEKKTDHASYSPPINTNKLPYINTAIDLHNWPFDDNSLDYIVLPHVLEFSNDPHAILREAQRCLRAGGYLSITAFNPHSILRFQSNTIKLGDCRQWLTRKRLLDWMKLLNLYPDRGAFGQWRPFITKQNKVFDHLAWLDKTGERWWPQAANIFALRAVKHVLPDTRQIIKRPHILFKQLLQPKAAINSHLPNNHTLLT